MQALNVGNTSDRYQNQNDNQTVAGTNQQAESTLPGILDQNNDQIDQS